MEKKSGRNLHLELVGTTYDDNRAGTLTLTINPQPLVPATLPCWEVLVQASNGNGQNLVYVGNALDGCFIELAAGVSITIPFNDAEKIIVRGQAGNEVVNWMAMI